MKIIYKKSSKKFSSKQLKKFFDRAMPGKTMKQCQDMIKRSTIFGAFDGRGLVGVVRALDDGVYGFITDVIVDRGHRKIGIGKALVKKICSDLKKRNIKIIHCSTSKKLMPFYKSAAKFKYDPDEITLYLRNF